eukprot:CAMPEP_0206613158 /NCGR_PEP_ID=MMETSP0325_2-20121206/56502_1 /ASSEMBLY_ACC=CAM_ASM_000347 /TAXON_ID=2866 /ORGANISM="Crypthecodinium cohnii, Strain Seligo" /LENGTH=35 /DNA_ID= /DNA_START= /DNA_END= /DNA_ORIENTATION=
MAKARALALHLDSGLSDFTSFARGHLLDHAESLCE